MEQEFSQLKKQLESIRLSKTERTRMEQVLREYRAHYPVRVMGTPVSVLRGSWFSVHRVTAVVGVLAIMLISGTISYAAEGALPGEALYPVKVAVNEPLRDTLARTPEDRVLLEVEKVDRRLREAETLAITGRFDTSAREDVEARVTKHIDAVYARTLALENTDGEDRTITDMLDATLDVHASILRALEEDEVDGKEIGALLAHVRKADVVGFYKEESRGEDEVAVSKEASATGVETGVEIREEEDGPEGVSEAASDLALEIAETEEELEKLQENSIIVDNAARISVRDEVDRLLDIADEALEEAQQSLESREFEKAEKALVFSQRVMQRVSLILNAFTKLPLDIKLFPIDPYPAPIPQERMELLLQQGDVEGVSVEKDEIENSTKGSDEGRKIKVELPLR